MLATEDRHEYPAFPFSQVSGSKIWRLVSLELQIPYFFVNYAFMEGDDWVSQASILWKEDDLLDFCREVQGDSSTKIIQIALLAPSSTSEIKTWRMITLKEIWRGRIRDHQHREMVYVGIEGERHLGSLATDDESQIELLENIYFLATTLAQAQGKSKAKDKRR